MASPDLFPKFSLRRRVRRRPLTMAASICLLAFSVPFFPAHTADGYVIRSRTVNGVPYVHLSDVAGYYGLGLSGHAASIRLSSSSAKLDLSIGHRGAVFKGVTMTLFFPPRAHRGDLLVSEHDLRYLIDPVLRDRALRAAPLRVIVLDPGHGDKDTGAVRGRYVEKRLNLEIAERVRGLLTVRGYRVIMTRTGDSRVSLAARVRLAETTRADLFVSIHCNAANAPSASGIETLIVTPVGTPPSDGRKLRRTASRGNRWDVYNTRLGFELQREAVRVSGARDRGVKHRHGLYLLRQAPCPAALIEMGFISNGKEAARLADPGHQARAAAGVVNGIIRYHWALWRSAKADRKAGN